MTVEKALENQEMMVLFLRDAKEHLDTLIKSAVSITPNDSHTIGLVFDALFRAKGDISLILQDQESWLEIYKERKEQNG